MTAAGFHHGLSGHPLYRKWKSMMQRCSNPTNRAYANYGGRGILVCERWKNFASFLADMGMPPPGTTLDRIDNDKGYSPENCRWATPADQNRNQRRTRLITYRGETKCLREWASHIGMDEKSLSERLKNWTLEQAMTMPKRVCLPGKWATAYAPSGPHEKDVL